MGNKYICRSGIFQFKSQLAPNLEFTCGALFFYSYIYIIQRDVRAGLWQLYNSAFYDIREIEVCTLPSCVWQTKIRQSQMKKIDFLFSWAKYTARDKMKWKNVAIEREAYPPRSNKEKKEERWILFVNTHLCEAKKRTSKERKKRKKKEHSLTNARKKVHETALSYVVRKDKNKFLMTTERDLSWQWEFENEFENIYLNLLDKWIQIKIILYQFICLRKYHY